MTTTPGTATRRFGAPGGTAGPGSAAPGGRGGKPGDSQCSGRRQPLRPDKSNRDPRSTPPGGTPGATPGAPGGVPGTPGAPATPGAAPGGGLDPNVNPALSGKSDPNAPIAPASGKDKGSKAPEAQERTPAFHRRTDRAASDHAGAPRAFHLQRELQHRRPGLYPRAETDGPERRLPGARLAVCRRYSTQKANGWMRSPAKGWISHRPELNQQVLRNYTQNPGCQRIRGAVQ